MKFRIHYTKNGVEDYFNLEFDTAEEIRSMAVKQLEARGIDLEKDSYWSESLDG